MARNQLPILRAELARSDIVQKERKNQNQKRENIWDIGHEKGEKEKTGQVGRSYKNSGRINSNQHQTDGHHRGNAGNDGRWQPATRQIQGYKSNEART